MKAIDAKLATLALSTLSLCLMINCERPAEKPDTAEAEPSAEASAPQKPSELVEDPAAARPSTQADEAPKIFELWGAKATEGTVQIELHDLTAAETKQLAKLFDEKRFSIAIEALADEADKLPARFAGIDAVDVLTPDGPKRLEIARIAQQDGPSRIHFSLYTKPSDALPKELGWTLATPAGQMAAEASMRLDKPQPVHAKAAPKLRNAFLSALDEKERKHVAEKLENEHMMAVSARFPSPHGQVVAINVPGKQHMPLAQGVFVAEDTGAATHTIKAPFVGPLGAVEILAVADPDGDDIDGVLYRTNTDGYWIKWVHFDEHGNVIVDILAGFAA